ncbi:MAG: hypothetical protein ABIF10_03200 [Candidatus Woesearchaeota archaeon]
MKRSQQASAATLIGVITLLILFYILFLPPDERAALLDEQPSKISSSSPTYTDHSVKNKTVFVASPGKISYQSLDEIEYDLPAFTLSKTSEARVIQSINNFRVRNGWFDKTPKTIAFGIDDLQNTENILLSFNAPRHKGTLTVKLNSQNIYEFDIETSSPSPISLNKRLLAEGENILEFSISSVGARFWATNEYSFSDMKITADITDNSRQESRNTFYISPEEGENIEKATLRFNPECNTRDVGTLDVSINGKSIFTGVPDCGTVNSVVLSPSMLNIGKNSVRFKTEKGTYLIDQIQVRTELEEPVQPTWYFELESDLFKTKGKEERCGETDGVCPDDCNEDLDRDCCFEKYKPGYWCDVKTDYIGDRCVGFVDEKECARCQSGYEDKDGQPPEKCENLCGDDTDDECHYGCKPKYDKDCCWNIREDQYWCDDLPITGEDFVCIPELTTSTCQNCQTGYKSENRRYDCPASEEDESELRSGVDLTLIFRFTESGETKEAEMWINGKATGFSTRESSFRKNINNLVEPGTNSIRLKPKTDLDIRELEISLD